PPRFTVGTRRRRLRAVSSSRSFSSRPTSRAGGARRGARERSRKSVPALYRALMYAGSWFCHQLPERSPHLLGVQLPLCWRCTGIFLGALALFCWLLAKKRVPPLLPCLLLSLLVPLDVLHAVLTHGD